MNPTNESHIPLQHAKTSNRKESQLPSSQNSIFDQRYLKIMDGTEGKQKPSDHLAESMERTPDTDLRREFHYSERNLETPEAVRSKAEGSIGDESAPLAMKTGTDNNTGKQPDSQQLEYETMVKIDSPSPHKQEKFKNLQPQQKSRSTKKEYTNTQDNETMGVNMVKFFDNIPE